MKGSGNRVGFTIVELTMAIVATAILALTAGVALQSVYRAIQRQSAMATLQGNMRVAVPVVCNLAREARNADVSAPAVGSTGTVFRVGSNAIYRANSSLLADAVGNNLVYERGSAAGNKMVLSSGWVTAFSVVRATNSISFVLELNNTNDSLRVGGNAYFRN